VDGSISPTSLSHCHVAGTVIKILNRNRFGEGNDTHQGRHVFLFYKFFGGFSLKKIILRITIYSNILVGNAGRIVNTGTRLVNSEFVTALNT
jgi:hypothetical protein